MDAPLSPGSGESFSLVFFDVAIGFRVQGGQSTFAQMDRAKAPVVTKELVEGLPSPRLAADITRSTISAPVLDIPYL